MRWAKRGMCSKNILSLRDHQHSVHQASEVVLHSVCKQNRMHQHNIETVFFVRESVKLLTLSIVEDMLAMMKKGIMVINVPSLRPNIELFPPTTKFSLYRTIRNDQKPEFFPTPPIEVLHLLF